MPTVQQLESILRQADRILQSAEDKAVRAINRTLRARLAELEARLKRLDRQRLLGIADTAKREARARELLAQLSAAIQAFDLGDRDTGVPQAMREAIVEAHRTGVDTATKLLASYDDSLDVRAAIDLEAVNAALQNVQARLSRHSEEFRQRAEDAIVSGLVRGEGPRRVAARLRDATGVSIADAERVARTETIRAHDASARATYGRNNVELIQCCETLDSKVCGYCATRHMHVYKIEDCPIPQHPNCRGTPLPWRQEWLDSGLVDIADLQKSRDEILSRTKDKLRTGPTPAEKFDGKPAAKAVWLVPKEPVTADEQAFARLKSDLTQSGLSDRSLDYIRDPESYRPSSLRAAEAVYKRGKDATEVALAQPPIKLEATADQLSLADGRHRWLAARLHEAEEIRASVRYFDEDGDEVGSDTLSVPIAGLTPAELERLRKLAAAIYALEQAGAA